MDNGPFVKDHPLFSMVREMKPKGVMGFTYENDDKYAGIWFTYSQDAHAFRNTLNARFGYPIIGEPDSMNGDNESNPFVCDAVCVRPQPREKVRVYLSTMDDDGNIETKQMHVDGDMSVATCFNQAFPKKQRCNQKYYVKVEASSIEELQEKLKKHDDVFVKDDLGNIEIKIDLP